MSKLEAETPVVITTDIENAIKVHTHLGKYLEKVIPAVQGQLEEKGITSPENSDDIDDTTKEMVHSIACIKQFYESLTETIEKVIDAHGIDRS